MPWQRISLVSILVLSSCLDVSGPVSSEGKSLETKTRELASVMKLHSPLLDASYRLQDANASQSLPGASYKAFRVWLKVRPEDVRLWLDGKENWLTSFPHRFGWLGELDLPPGMIGYLESLPYDTYYYASSGSEYTLWVNETEGIILMDYIQQ